MNIAKIHTIPNSTARFLSYSSLKGFQPLAYLQRDTVLENEILYSFRREIVLVLKTVLKKHMIKTTPLRPDVSLCLLAVFSQALSVVIVYHSDITAINHNVIV